jgi:predicted DNA-binding protein
MKNKPKHKPFSVPLPEDLKKAIDRLAKADSRPAASYVRLVLEKHIQEAQQRQAT